MVARALHNASACGDFVPIDCGSLVGPLMESELFGHTRGAFTGASDAKRGLIELADGGTAFFDEIGDLPLDLQVKLLRLLQEHEYRAIGSLQRRKIDLRVIAATHRNLAAAVENGTFRQDLFYRLNVITIRLPPLRERKEDIPLLVERFLECAGERAGRRYTVTREVMDALLVYDWPGNVRELQNCLDRMTAVDSGPLLHKMDLPSAVVNSIEANRSAIPARAAAAMNGGMPANSDGVIPLEQVERSAILNALAKTKGDRAAAAHFLGIGRTTLYRKLRGYGIATMAPVSMRV